MEDIDINSVKLYPNWLISLFKIKNDHIPCKNHVDKNGAFLLKKNYCIICNLTICKACFKDHNTCNYIIQLRKGTPNEDGQHNLTIEEKEIKNHKDFVSLNYVQSYKFNGRSVYYIFNRKKLLAHNSDACKICGHSLINALKQFCSLECMVEGVENIVIEDVENVENIDIKNIEGEDINVKGLKELDEGIRLDESYKILKKQRIIEKQQTIFKSITTNLKKPRYRKQPRPTRSPYPNLYLF